MNVAIIGYGAIAQYVATKLNASEDVTLSHVICREGREDHAKKCIGGSVQALTSFLDINADIDLVVECGGHAAFREHAVNVLKSGTDLVSVSSGVLADDLLMDEVEKHCDNTGSQMQFVPGAIGCLDALNAAKVGGLDEVTYVGRKKPAGWKGSPAEDKFDLDNLTEVVCHFEGTARDAARLYPKNANVAATTALAGVGLDKTKVTLFADPTVTRNTHEITASGAFGSLYFKIEGASLPDSPRSSALTAMSVVDAVLARLKSIRV
jgi:aspartate dehydrogenase